MEQTFFIQLNSWTDRETGQPRSNIRVVSSDGSVITGQAFMLAGVITEVNLYQKNNKKKSKKTSSVEKPKKSKKTSSVME